MLRTTYFIFALTQLRGKLPNNFFFFSESLQIHVFSSKCKAGGKPSTWFPPEGLVEQKLKTIFERNTIDEGEMRHKN